jgi:hypothetical protein
MIPTCFIIFPAWCYPGGEIDQWVHATRSTIIQRHHSSPSAVMMMSSDLQRVLLSEEDPDEFQEEEDESSSEEIKTSSVIIQGVPRRPLYKEIAYRLYSWNRQQVQESSEEGLIVSTTQDNYRLIVPAEELGFQEEDTTALMLPPHPPKTVHEIRSWLTEAGDLGILRLLGCRHTIGTATKSLLPPPSRKALLEAASRLHHPNNKLTVAARARSKHAHRGCQDLFFGIAKGPQEAQNEATKEILVKLLQTTVWMNLHTFGGLQENNPVLEIRVASGYGARWTGDWSTTSIMSSETTMPLNIQFRGFLEPQMENGHESKWRH